MTLLGLDKYFLPPVTKLWQGNVFTPVCQSFCSQGGMHARGACMVGACIAGGHVCPGGHVWQGSCAWQERRPLQRAVRILLECILVKICILGKIILIRLFYEI